MSHAPQRIQLRRTKGWHLPANTAVVSRPSRWGNRFRAARPEERAKAVEKYRAFLYAKENAPLRAAAVAELRGKNLACWCPLEGPCHADVLLELVNR